MYGQVIQETNLAFSSTEEMVATEPSVLDETAMDEYPHLGAMYQHALTSGHSIDSEFEFGLELSSTD